VVGKTIAANAQPEKIRNGTLFVKVSSSVWMQQLQFMKDMIAEKLNQRLNREVVKNIFFVVGQIDSPGPAEKVTEPSTRAVEEDPKVDPQFLDSVSDPELRQAFKKLLKSYSRRLMQE
jgi:hypothetical protein